MLPCWPMSLARTPLSHRPTCPSAALRAASASRPAGTAPIPGGAPTCRRLADQLLDCTARTGNRCMRGMSVQAETHTTRVGAAPHEKSKRSKRSL